MELKDILNDDVSHDEAKDAVKEHIRNVVDSFVVEEDKGSDSEEEEDDSEEEEDDEDEDHPMHEALKEAKQVTAYTPSGRSQELEISRLRELKKYAQTGKYDYFTVTDQDGGETDYAVDPSGNLTEM